MIVDLVVDATTLIGVLAGIAIAALGAFVIVVGLQAGRRDPVRRRSPRAVADQSAADYIYQELFDVGLS